MRKHGVSDSLNKSAEPTGPHVSSVAFVDLMAHSSRLVTALALECISSQEPYASSSLTVVLWYRLMLGH